MDDHPDTGPDAGKDNSLDELSDKSERFKRAIRGLEKPKPTTPPEGFRTLTIEERDKRLLAVERLATERFAVEQIVSMLGAWGIKVSRSQVYEYLQQVKRPPGYKSARQEQRIHDRYAIEHIIRIAEDAAERGLRVDPIAVGRRVDGFRFKPDGRFWVEYYGFFLEEQISPLNETLWKSKINNYVRYFKSVKDRSRVLFVTGAKGDVAYARRVCRTLLDRARHPEYGNRFLFIDQLKMDNSSNKAFDPVWQTATGPFTSLLEFLKSLGPKVRRTASAKLHLASGHPAPEAVGVRKPFPTV